MSTINWYRIKKSNLQDLFDSGCELGKYEKEIFLIVDSWDTVNKYPKYFNHDNWGFNDEYKICDSCYTVIFRISPDSYQWTPEYYQNIDGEMLCKDCAQFELDDSIDRIQDQIDNNQTPKSFEWIFELPNDFKKIEYPNYPDWGKWENGLHPGQNDSPLKQGRIVRSIKNDNFPLFQIVFRIFPSQFDVSWDTYIRISPNQDISLSDSDWDTFLNQFAQLFNSPEGRSKYDNAELAQLALKSASGKFSKLSWDSETGKINVKSTNNLDEYLQFGE